MPISKIQEAMTNQFRIQNGQSALPSTPEKTTDEAKAGDAASAPLVPGFGEVAVVKLTPIPGFGVPLSSAAAGAKKSGASGDSSSASSGSTSSTPPLDDRIRQYATQWAKSQIKEYDKNSNGQLEKDEWSQMKEKYWAADKNHDAIITVDELIEFQIADSWSGPRQSSGVAIASSAGLNSAAPGNSGKPRLHPLTPTERLQKDMKDIPSWFITTDTSGDGVVTMSEYIKVKGDTVAAAKEFAQFDLNNDGVITPQEAMKASKKK
jgi:hypothetical protein